MEVNSRNFQLLHKHLLSILSTNNHESEHLPEKIMQYIGMIVESERNPTLSEDFFEFFCQNSGNKIIKLTLEVDPMLSVKVLSMLFINLTSHHWISYLLCQSFIIDAIQYYDTPKDQQWSQYYISLLKSLSIRLNQQQVSLFFNKKFCKFPLLYESLKYYNHPDSMVRTNIMNIILGIMKLKDQRVIKYLGRFPFTSYVLTYCCQVKSRIQLLNNHLKSVIKNGLNDKEQREKHRSHIRSYYIDMIDYISYLNDLIDLGPAELGYFVENSIMAYIILPFLNNLTDPQSVSLLKISSIFLVLITLKNITNEKFKTMICLLLFSRKIPKYFESKIYNGHLSYMPQIYSQTFNPNQYFWNKYNYQIERQCVKIFSDVANFEIEHENLKQDLSATEKFNEEISLISNTFGFNIITGGSYPDAAPFTSLYEILGFSSSEKQKGIRVEINLSQSDLELVKNPLRQSLFQILNRSVDKTDEDSLLLCLSTLINSLTKSEQIENRVLQYCGLLLPGTDTIKYKQEFNIDSLKVLENLGKHLLKEINRNLRVKTEAQQAQRDENLFSLETIKNIGIIFLGVQHEKLSIQQEQVLAEFYRNSILELKQLIIRNNMKVLVQNFQIQYSKWTQQSLVFLPNLSQNVLRKRKSAKEIFSDEEQNDEQENILYFRSKKEEIFYFIRKFALAQNIYSKYWEKYISKQKLIQKEQISSQDEKDMRYQRKKEEKKGEGRKKWSVVESYNTIYSKKYQKTDDEYKIGHSYRIGFKNMVDCFSEEKKTKGVKKYLIVEDLNNFLLVEPSSEENSAKIIANHPWKYVAAENDRETGKKLKISLSHCYRGENPINLYFEEERKCLTTIQWMNKLKLQRYQSEQAFILAYVKDCLSRI